MTIFHRVMPGHLSHRLRWDDRGATAVEYGLIDRVIEHH